MSRQLIKLKTIQNMIEDTPNSSFSSQSKYKHASLDRKARERSVTTSLSRCDGCAGGSEAAAAAASMSKGGCCCGLISMCRLKRKTEVAHDT